MATLGDLPNELLLKIFDQLPQKKPLTRVCQRWNLLVAGQLHLNIDLSLAESVHRFLQMRFQRSYQRLTIIGVMLLRPEMVDYHRSGRNLRPKRPRMDVDPSTIVNKCLEVVRLCEPMLVELKLSFGSETDHSLLQFLPRDGSLLSRLECLDISFNNQGNEKPDVSVARRMENETPEVEQEFVPMPNLRRFILTDNRVAGNRDIKRKLYDVLVRKAKGIQEITLDCLHFPCYSDFRLIRSFARQLTRVSCFVRPIYVNEFFQLSFPKVQFLRLNCYFCSEVPETAYHFFEQLSCLTEVAIEHAKNTELYPRGVYKCNLLEKITIHERYEAPLEGIKQLANLKELCLQRCFDQNDVPESDTLQTLILERCTLGSPFYDLLSMNVPNLTELVIIGDEQFDDWCLQGICETMANLRRLSVTMLTFIEDPVTERGFRSIGMLSKLEYLYLETFDGGYFTPHPLFTDDWVQQLKATEVHLKGFKKFYVHNLLDFVMNPNIKNLILDRCGKDTRIAEAVRKIADLVRATRRLPQIMVVSEL